MKFDADTYWRKKEKPCPYAEGNKCFIVAEPNPESCKGCRWFEPQESEGSNADSYGYTGQGIWVTEIF